VLGSLHGLVGRAEASQLIRERILRVIAEAYPWLAAECRRQKTEYRRQKTEIRAARGFGAAKNASLHG
jgi:rhamnose utilization protein RhaD (predicted bifunctional aldolase and dehydrogenase)